MNENIELATESQDIIEPCEQINKVVNDADEITRSLDEVTRALGTTVQKAPGCSTVVVGGLSKQIIAEMNAIEPNCLVSFDDLNVTKASDAANLLLQPAAKEALKRAIRARGQKLVVNSAYRTLPQQLMLYNRAQADQCGIPMAAYPSTSNHEDGLALDIQDPRDWEPFLVRHGWRPLPGDPPHFDFKGGGRADISNIAVKAFQRLWNKNNPHDRIDEEGDFGPITLARLNKSPAGGFGVATGSSTVQPMKILRLSNPLMEGEDVRKVQEALVKANINVTVDGIFGPATEKAVKEFQQQKGLTVDGAVGPATRIELNL
jgi:hypothetical protein